MHTSWALAGFANSPQNSNAVARTLAGRTQFIPALVLYLNQHPTYQPPPVAHARR